MPAKSRIGVVGLGVMGQNLALNIARNGFPVSAYNRTPDKTEATLSRVESGMQVIGARTPEELVAGLERPRRILLMVKAGKPVDSVIETFVPLLDKGDMIVDGGNSHPDHTERRVEQLAGRGIRFVGMGVSGGEEGALHGPSIMPGGERAAYDELAPILEKIAARVEDGPCVTYIGKGAAGHFVKMTHNGIEYGDMQLIAECYDLMRNVLGMSVEEMTSVFEEWNRGILESFLIEITAKILKKTDAETGRPMVDVILDKAGQKGTGRWTSQIALEMGVPLPTIHAAVEARGLSSRKDERVAAAKVLRGPEPRTVDDPSLVDAIRDALYCSKICSYAQGWDLLAKGDEEKEWGLDLAEIARIWKGGCIIRARFLERIQKAYAGGRRLPNLLLDEELGGFLQDAQGSWRRVVALAAEHGVPVLAMAGSLSYFDSYRRERLPQDLTQAQRDFFGAHTYERVDKPRGESFHTEWE